MGQEIYGESYLYASCVFQVQGCDMNFDFQAVEKSGCCSEIKGEKKDVCERFGVEE